MGSVNEPKPAKIGYWNRASARKRRGEVDDEGLPNQQITIDDEWRRINLLGNDWRRGAPETAIKRSCAVVAEHEELIVLQGQDCLRAGCRSGLAGADFILAALDRKSVV